MQNITNSNVRKRGRRELRAVFKTLRFKDGLTIGTEEDAAGEDDFVYYYNKSRDGQIGNYIVYEVVASDPTRRADDKVIGREFYAQVDVFSTSSFESRLLQETLVKFSGMQNQYDSMAADMDGTVTTTSHNNSTKTVNYDVNINAHGDTPISQEAAEMVADDLADKINASLGGKI